MIVAIVGCRDADEEWCDEVIAGLCDENVDTEWKWTCIVTGCCPTGADKAAREFAVRNKIYVKSYIADWYPNNDGKLDRSAGPKRNSMIVAHPGLDKVYAIWDGVSRGTKDTIDKAVKAGIPVEIIPLVRSET